MGENVLVNALHPSVAARVHPQFAQIYNKYQAPKLRADQVSYEEYNADRSRYTFPIAQGPKPEVGSCEIYNIPVRNPEGTISLQVYVPTDEAASSARRNGMLPVHVNFHGGGWVIGGLTSDESWCRIVCQAIGCIIVNVDYRMAPEYPHPVPLWDSWSALKWTFEQASSFNIDTTRVSIGGLSAGGQISAALALLARDDPDIPKLVLQLLVVPVVDGRFFPIEGSCDPEKVPYESYVTNEFAPCLPLQRMRWFCNLWLGTDIEKRTKMTNNFLCSPIVAESHADLAPASIHVAEIDTLYSEGIAYHHKLMKAGTKSKLKIYEGVGHPFANWNGELSAGKEFVEDSIKALKEAYGLDES